jgi:hypothetical protein
MKGRRTGAPNSLRRRTRRLTGLLSLAAIAIAIATSSSSPAHAASAAHDSWKAPAAIPSAKTYGPPALAVYDGLLYAAWGGASGPAGIWYSAYNGTKWTPQARVPSALSPPYVGPALAAYNGDLYAFWEGHSSSTSGVWYSAFNGSTWSAQKKVPSALTQSVYTSHLTLAVYLGSLYVAWMGDASPRHIWYSSFNGTTWTAQHEAPNGAQGNPALAVYQGKLYLSWLYCVDCKVSYETYNGTSWTGAATFPSDALAGPALATYSGDLYAAWIIYPSGDVTYAPYNGTNWLAEISITSASVNTGCGAPALAAYAGALYAAWSPAGGCAGAVDYSSGP